MLKGDNQKFKAHIFRCVLLVQIHLRIDGFDTTVGNHSRKQKISYDITNSGPLCRRINTNTDTHPRRPSAGITLPRTSVVDEDPKPMLSSKPCRCTTR